MRTNIKETELDDRNEKMVGFVNKVTQGMMQSLQENMLEISEVGDLFTINEVIGFHSAVIILISCTIISTINQAVIHEGGEFDIPRFIHNLNESIKNAMGIPKDIKKTPKNMNTIDKNRIITF